jgi:predicted dehydrogenase
VERVNVGIIGCGRISDLHARGYLGNPAARIVAVCDTSRERAEEKAREWGAERAYTDWSRLLADSRVDAVDIITPQRWHEEMALAAVSAGKHVSVQKPMTVSLASADRMVAAAERSSRVFKLCENYLFYPPLVQAKRLIDEGRIGEPTSMRIKFISGQGGWAVPDAAWAWRAEEHRQGFGMQTFDHGHHMWSVAYHLLGELERVFAWIDSVDGKIDCPAVIMWKYRNAPRFGVCDYSHCTALEIPTDYYANDEWFEVTGSKGFVQVVRCTGRINPGPPVRLFSEGRWCDLPEVESDWASGFRGATDNFVDAIAGRARPAFTAREGREILKIDLAIQASARLRKEVELASFTDPAPSNGGAPQSKAS